MSFWEKYNTDHKFSEEDISDVMEYLMGVEQHLKEHRIELKSYKIMTRIIGQQKEEITNLLNELEEIEKSAIETL